MPNPFDMRRDAAAVAERAICIQSFFGALSLTSMKVRICPTEVNQDTEQTILPLASRGQYLKENAALVAKLTTST